MLDLYFLPQAFVMSKDGSKEEFAGITQFGLEYDNNMMYQALVQKTGIFKGNMGHPVPSKISEEQIPFYTKQMQDLTKERMKVVQDLWTGDVRTEHGYKKNPLQYWDPLSCDVWGERDSLGSD